MNIRPDITISSYDADRLYQLINKSPRNSMATIMDLEEELGRATIAPPQAIPPSIVTMNSTVQFLIESTQQEFELTLVYPKDTDSDGRTVSIFAPIGSALLGLAIGDEIEWPKPLGGQVKVKIIGILYQPERSGQYEF